MKGRRYGDAYRLYGFTSKVVGRKYIAICLYCNKHMQNTAGVRLKTHSKICKARTGHNNAIEMQHSAAKVDQGPATEEHSIQEEMFEQEEVYCKIEEVSPDFTSPADAMIASDSTAPKDQENLYEEQIEYIQDYLKDEGNDKSHSSVLQNNEEKSSKKMPQSKKIDELQMEKMKAEIQYWKKKSAYFTEEMENLRIQRSLLTLQAKKLRIEIENLQK